MPLAPLHAVESAPPPTTDAPEAPRAPNPSQADPASGVTPAKVMYSLRRRWFVALPLAAALAALVYWGADSRLVPVYTARTLVNVGAHQPVLVYDVGGRADTANNQRTQIALAKSRVVRQAVVRDLAGANLAALRDKPDPVGALEKEIVADFTVAPEILRLTMKGSDPDELLLLLNTVREAYLREVSNKDRGERAARLEHLTDLAAKHEAALKDARRKVSSKAEAHGVRDFPELRAKYDRLVSQIHSLQTELLLARLATPKAEEPTPDQVDDPGPAAPEPAAVEAALDQVLAADPVAEGSRKELVRLEKKKADYERRLLDYQNDSDYKQVVADLKTVSAALAARREALRPAVTEQLRARAPKPPPRPAQAAAPAPTPKYQLPLLEAEILKKEREAAALAKEITELELVRTEITRQEEQLAVVTSKIRPLEVELQAPPRARVVEDAAIIEMPKGSQSIKYAGAPAGAAFFAVLALVVWLDLRRGRVTEAEDLAAARVRTIGAVPRVAAHALPTFAPPADGSTRDEHLKLTGAIDMTRAVIAPIVAATPGYALVVTSAAAGEGKTVLASHLAARFARSGLRTLLIDTDVRRPQIHRLFGLAPAPGLGEWVTESAGHGEVVQSSTVPGLDVLAAGRCDPQAVTELIDLRFPELLDSLKRVYDVVVIDTAPPLSTPEALAVSRAADGVVLSVMRDVSRVSGVVACVDRLATVNARVLGAVVTGAVPPRYHGS